LCGKVWVAGRDPEKYPVCPECKELYEGFREPNDSGDGSGGSGKGGSGRGGIRGFFGGRRCEGTARGRSFLRAATSSHRACRRDVTRRRHGGFRREDNPLPILREPSPSAP